MSNSPRRYRDPREEALRIGMTLFSIAVLVAICFLYIEVIHNVFRIERGLVSAAGSILVLPIILAAIGVSYFFIYWYRESTAKRKLNRRFLITTGIELIVLALSMLLRIRLLMALLDAPRDRVLILLGRSPDLLIYGGLAGGLVMLGWGIYIAITKRRRF